MPPPVPQRPSTNPIRIRYRYIIDHALRVYDHRFRRHIGSRTRILAGMLCLIVIALAIWKKELMAWAFFFVPFGVFFIFLDPILRWNLRRRFLKKYPHGYELSLAIDDNEIQISDERFQLKHRWDVLSDLVETPYGYFFLIETHPTIWIPKEAFSNPSEFEELATIAARHSVNVDQPTP